jgi:hypothetical protein
LNFHSVQGKEPCRCDFRFFIVKNDLLFQGANNANRLSAPRVQPVPQKTPSLSTDDWQSSGQHNGPRHPHSQAASSSLHPPHGSSVQSQSHGHSHGQVPFRTQLTATTVSGNGGSAGSFAAPGRNMMSPVGADGQQQQVKMAVGGSVQHHPHGGMHHQAHHVQAAESSPSKFSVR